ncbi:hypothetical protein L228DRAFT_269815 [Xylona heveae TC161]|uniref:Uncharacterized protein n=1 Tax=Xylona heveae (strain CBS 132557 / TC161) TaxID=1328760 RepID=A0A165FVP9_XYLHT|nr:hypothetical protein L228DRAFT_269815 [Xylona heveae TC161]KZF21437.1 hypothetical protein L228DRAFT_269815 [Xylona heveae TC161]
MSREASPERDFSLQKYALLQEQHDSLQERLRLSVLSPSASQSSTSSVSSNAVSESSSPCQPSFLPPKFHEPEYDLDETKLYGVNHQIKTTLTGLLNCESVKHDAAFRSWVQSRLMDAEMELRAQKRRRSSVSEEVVDNIRHMLD